MANLNFDGEEEIAPGVSAYRFATPEGKRYYERDPAKAMQLGMPPDYLNRSAGAAPVRPDARLASNGGFMVPGAIPITNENYGKSPAQEAPMGPPVAEDMPDVPPEQQLADAGVDLGALHGSQRGRGSTLTPVGRPDVMPVARAKPSTKAQPAPQARRDGPSASAQSGSPVDPNADFENRLDKAFPLPSRYTRTAKREAGYRPESMKVSGADPNAVAKLSTAYDDLDEQRSQIAQLQLDAAEEQAGNERINARVARLDAEEQAKRQETLVKAKEDAKRRQMAMLDAEEQQVAKRSPDSQRIFKQKGSGSYFLAALMRGLGELGASMSKSNRNGAAEIIDRRIDQDIAEQEAEIAADRDAVSKRKNAYASMLADGLDPEFAREKLKWLQSLQAEAVAREAAAETSSQQAKAYFLKQADERAMANLAFKTSLLDKQSVQIDSKYDRGSAGGLVENPKYDEQVQKRLQTRNALRAENMGTTQDAYEAGKKTEATTAASGTSDKVALPAVTQLNEALSNVRAADKATADLDSVLNQGGEVNLHPAALRDMQPFDEFFFGSQSADEDRYGKEGNKVRNIIGTEMTSTRNAALGTLSEADKRNQTDNAIGDGSPESIRRYMQGKKQGYQSQLVQVLNAMSPAERRKVYDSSDDKTKRLITDALNGPRENTELLDVQR